MILGIWIIFRVCFCIGFVNMCWNLLGLGRPTKDLIRPALHCTHPGEDFQIWKQYTLTFCHKLSRKTFWRLCSRWMEKTPACSHYSGKHVVYTHPGKGFQFWKQYTLTFRHKLSRKTFWHFVWKRHQLAHTAVENILYTPILARASRSESSTLSSFVTKLAGKHFLYYGLLNTAHYTILATPFRSESSTLTFCHKHSRRTYGLLRSRQLAHTEHQHMLLRKYLPRNICSDINGKPMRASPIVTQGA